MKQQARRLVILVLALLVAAVAQAQPARKWSGSRAPRPLPPREVKFPPYQIRSLPNGLQVVVVAHDEQPSVSLRMIVRAGAAQDPPGKPGVAAMLASLLDQGTATRNALDVADAIDSAGGYLAVGLGRDLSFARVVVMKDSLALGAGLLADVIRRPAFEDAELERQRKQTLSGLQVSYQDPGFLADLVFDRLVYGASPYGLPGNGTTETVEEISRGDLVRFHQAYFAPNNALLAVVGDVTVDEAMEAVNAAFADWERRDVRLDKPPDPPEPARRVMVIDKPDAVQTEIRVGHLGIARKNADFLPVDLAVRILGGEGANRLHRVLRTERGLTYGVSADTEAFQRGGKVMAQTSTRSEATGEVLRLIVDEYWRLRRERVGDEELGEAKAYLTGHFPLTIETADDIATQVLNALFYELPLEELQTYRQRVNSVGVDDVGRVTYKYLRPDRLSVVLVGNAAAFAEQLRGVGFGKYEVVRLADLDVTAPDFRKKPERTSARHVVDTLRRLLARPGVDAGARRQGLGHRSAPLLARASRPSAAQGAAAEELIRRAIEAKGGLEKLKSLKTVEARATTTLMLPQGPAKTETTTYIEYPNRFRVEAHLPPGDVVQVYAGEDNVWAQDPRRGVIEVPAQPRRDFKASVERDLVPLLLRAAGGELKLRLVDPGADAAGENTRGVEVSGGGMERVTLFIDAATGLVARQVYQLPGVGGTAEEIFSDYRDVDGLKVAFKASVRRNRIPVLERVVTEFKVNPPLKPGLFDRPKGGR